MRFHVDRCQAGLWTWCDRATLLVAMTLDRSTLFLKDMGHEGRH